jgi:predicted nucleic acid-binding protein
MPSVCVDTNIWFYSLARPKSEEQAKHRAAQRLVGSLHTPVVTPQILNELAYNLLRKRAWSEADIRALSGDLLLRCRYLSPGPAWHEEASVLRERFKLSFWDSLLLASAQSAGCDIVYSEDMQHGLRADTLVVINPFAQS